MILFSLVLAKLISFFHNTFMNEKLQRDDTGPWSGADNIRASFDALGVPYDCSISTYFQRVGRVIVKNDPVLVKAFGQEAVDLYERMLAEAELE